MGSLLLGIRGQFWSAPLVFRLPDESGSVQGPSPLCVSSLLDPIVLFTFWTFGPRSWHNATLHGSYLHNATGRFSSSGLVIDLLVNVLRKR